jgi:hypothetical protein
LCRVSRCQLDQLFLAEGVPRGDLRDYNFFRCDDDFIDLKLLLDRRPF